MQYFCLYGTKETQICVYEKMGRKIQFWQFWQTAYNHPCMQKHAIF
jgi:hypothetical protein